MATLQELGWNSFFEQKFAPFQAKGFEVGRVAIENRGSYLVYTPQGDFQAEIAGKLQFKAASAVNLPKVGDWVVMSTFPQNGKAIIHELLPRQSKFSRRAPGRNASEQVMATNINVIFVMQSLDGDFSPRRLERYLAMIYEGGITPVILLSKSDLCEDVPAKIVAATFVAPGVEVWALSPQLDEGVDKVRQYLKHGLTFALIGSSGVGKSTLVNRLLGQEVQKTAEVRASDSKGRHTTTHRELILLPEGGLLIDTPGMRELQLWEGHEGITETFNDVEDLVKQCRFSDCGHTNEPGCAVLAALAKGELSQSRYQSYLRLQRERAILEQSEADRRRKAKDFKRLTKQINQRQKSKYDHD